MSELDPKSAANTDTNRTAWIVSATSMQTAYDAVEQVLGTPVRDFA